MSDTSVNTVFLVGTGAEEGAWLPITTAIRAVAPAAPVEDGNPDHANFFMAELIAIFRGLRALEQANNAKHPSPIPEMLRKLRGQIAARLQNSAEIRLRPHFLKTVKDPEWGGSPVILTSNWDNLIERAFPKLIVQHVHGSVRSPQGLYLPSDYAFDPAHDQATQREMFMAQDAAIKYLWRARTVCIYGLGLDPLDNELAAIVHTGLGESNERTERVIIYNLAREEKRLTDRLKLLLHRREAPLKIEFRDVATT